MEHALPSWFEFVDSWHEFYLMAGTAAVTLAGLLFVAISLHVDALVDERHEHLLALARATLFSFVMVLVLSLMMLVPGQNLSVVALQLVILGGVILYITIGLMRWKPKVEHPDFSASLMRRRLALPVAAYALLILTGVALFVTRVPNMLNFAVAAVCMVLGNAAGASWDLLVRLAKVKRGA